MSSKYTLEDWEIAIIKGLVRRGDHSKQQILSYFTRPGRDINHRVISSITTTYTFRSIAPADNVALDSFIRMRRRLDQGHFSRVRRFISAVRSSAVFEFSYRLFPVGQGLFSTGLISRQAHAPFRWVYDCGTSNEKRRRLVLRGLASLRAETRADGKRDHINLFTVSHFDQDHVSGLKDLLRHFSVGTLMLPYVTPWDRLMIALDEGAAADSDLLAFLLAPTAYVLGLPGSEIGRIVLVGPSARPAGPPVAPPRLDGPDGREFGLDDLKIDIGDLPAEENVAAGRDPGLDDRRVEMLAPGGSLTIPHLWEFVPYNDPACVGLATQVFRDAAAALADQLRTTTDVDVRNDALTQLKALYAATFGATPKQKNIISLFQYCGPVGRSFLLNAAEEGFQGRLHSWRIGKYAAEGEWRFGLMMTGDGYLHTAQQRQSFVAFYRPHERLRRAGCFQVMHHGARANWRAGIAGLTRPVVSLFSSHPTGEYRHPHQEVWRDFAPYHPRQIDRRSGWTVRGYFIFT